MHGRVNFLKELRYGFEALRAICVARGRVSGKYRRAGERGVSNRVRGQRRSGGGGPLPDRGRLREYSVEKGNVCLMNPKEQVEAAYQRHLEVAVSRDLLDLKGMAKFTVGVALWHGGETLPTSLLAEGFFDVQLGEKTIQSRSVDP